MTDAILKGIGFGLVLSVAMGPVFFELVRLSMLLPYRKAVFFALGIVASDLALGLAVLLPLPGMTIPSWIRWVGGLFFIALGVAKLWQNRRMPAAPESAVVSPDVPAWKLFIKGVSLNAFNPFVLAFWVATSLLARLQYGDDTAKGVVFIASIALTIFAFDNLKMWLGGRFRGKLNLWWTVWISRITGVVFILAGLYILYATQ